MEKYIKYLIFINIFFNHGCAEGSCDELAENYKSIEINMKVEKISISRNCTLYGKDAYNENIKWRDISSWILDIHKNINLGDSVIKTKETTYIIIKKPTDTILHKYYLECQGQVYQK